MHHPKVVAAALKEYQAGKLTVTQLAGLAQTSVLRHLAEANWSTICRSFGSTRIARASVAQKASWDQIVENLGQSLSPLTILSPAQPTFNVFGTGTQTITVTGEAPLTGPASARLTGAPGFRIKKFVGLDGTYGEPVDGKTTLREETSSVGSSEPLGLFTLRAGQRFKIVLEYTAPPLGSPKGDVRAQLEIKGTGWAAGTPVVAHLRGLDLGIPIIPVNGDYYEIIVDPTSATQKILLEVPLKFYNLNKRAFTGSLVPESLPTGVTLIGDTIAVALAADSVKTAVARLSIDPKKVQIASGQIVTLAYKFPGGTSETSINLETLPSMRQWKSRTSGSWGFLDLILVVADTNVNSFSPELFLSSDAEVDELDATAKLDGMDWWSSGEAMVQNLFLGVNALEWSEMVKQSASFHFHMSGSW